MSGFKDMVAADRAGVFLDLEFFGEKHRVEGREILIVVDLDELVERQGGQDLAVTESTMLFYARAEDLPARRPAGQCLNVDGREYLIDKWTEDMGLATIVLHENITG